MLANWRTSLAQFDEMHGILSAGCPGGTSSPTMETCPCYGEIVEDNPFWAPSRFMGSNPRLDVDEIDDEVVVSS